MGVRRGGVWRMGSDSNGDAHGDSGRPHPDPLPEGEGEMRAKKQEPLGCPKEANPRRLPFREEHCLSGSNSGSHVSHVRPPIKLFCCVAGTTIPSQLRIALSQRSCPFDLAVFACPVADFYVAR